MVFTFEINNRDLAIGQMFMLYIDNALQCKIDSGNKILISLFMAQVRTYKKLLTK